MSGEQPPQQGDPQDEQLYTPEYIGKTGHGHAYIIDPTPLHTGDSRQTPVDPEEHFRQHPDARPPHWKQQPQEQHRSSDGGSTGGAESTAGGTEGGDDAAGSGGDGFYKKWAEDATEAAEREREKRREAAEKAALADAARQKAEDARTEALNQAADAATQRAAAEKAAGDAERLRLQREQENLLLQQQLKTAQDAARALQDQETKRLAAERAAQQAAAAAAAAAAHQAMLDAAHEEAIREAHMRERATTTDEREAAVMLGQILENTIENGTLTVRGVRGQLGERVRTDEEIRDDRDLTPAEQTREIEAQARGRLLAMRTIQELARQGVLTSGSEITDQRIIGADADADLTAIFTNGWGGHMHVAQETTTSRERAAFLAEVRGDGRTDHGRRPDARFMQAYTRAMGQRPTDEAPDTRTAAQRRAHGIDAPFRERDERRESFELRVARGEELTQADLDRAMEDIAQEVANRLEPDIVRVIPGTKMNFPRVSNRIPDYERVLATGEIGDRIEELLTTIGQNPASFVNTLGADRRGGGGTRTAQEVMNDMMDALDGAGGTGTRRADLYGDTPQERLASVFLLQLTAHNVSGKARLASQASINGTPATENPRPAESASFRTALGPDALRTGAPLDRRAQHIWSTLTQALREVELRQWAQDNPGDVPRSWRMADRAADGNRHAAASMFRRWGRRG